MIFAFLDWLQYRTGGGKYGDKQADGGMHLAFKGRVPKEVVAQLNEADMIFTQRLNSFTSWAMMYFSSAPVDHMAAYVGNGRVLHMTLSGSKVHSIQTIAKGARLLPVRMSKEQLEHWAYEFSLTEQRINKVDRFSHKFPAKVQIAWIGVRIILGLHPDRFRWKFAADIAIITLVFDGLSQLVFGTHSGIYLLGTYSVALAAIKIRSRLQNWFGTPKDAISHPDIGYQAFFKAGGLMFTNMGPIVVCDLGILPLHVVLRLARQSPDDSADDNFKEARQFFSDLVENWNLHPATENAKHDDGEKH